ncbi:unnamed protein product, partial [Cylicocyclus nassatus]
MSSYPQPSRYRQICPDMESQIVDKMMHWQVTRTEGAMYNGSSRLVDDLYPSFQPPRFTSNDTAIDGPESQ